MEYVPLALLVAYITVALLMSIITIIDIAKGYGFALLPGEIKKLNDVNWFGAIMSFIIMLFFFPLVYLYLFLGFIFTSHLPRH